MGACKKKKILYAETEIERNKQMDKGEGTNVTEEKRQRKVKG